MSPSATAAPATKVRSNASRASHTKAALENGYPHGHLGHLTEEEENALKGFKAYLHEKGLYQPGPPPSHDDPTLLRFLRARKWSIADAHTQFKDTEEWRKAIQLDVLYDTIDVEAYEQSRKLYPQWTGRRDRRLVAPRHMVEYLAICRTSQEKRQQSNGHANSHNPLTTAASPSTSSRSATSTPRPSRPTRSPSTRPTPRPPRPRPRCTRRPS